MAECDAYGITYSLTDKKISSQFNAACVNSTEPQADYKFVQGNPHNLPELPANTEASQTAQIAGVVKGFLESTVAGLILEEAGYVKIDPGFVYKIDPSAFAADKPKSYVSSGRQKGELSLSINRGNIAGGYQLSRGGHTSSDYESDNPLPSGYTRVNNSDYAPAENYDRNAFSIGIKFTGNIM
jgi:hypothetical protein